MVAVAREERDVSPITKGILRSRTVWAANEAMSVEAGMRISAQKSLKSEYSCSSIRTLSILLAMLGLLFDDAIKIYNRY